MRKFFEFFVVLVIICVSFFAVFDLNITVQQNNPIDDIIKNQMAVNAKILNDIDKLNEGIMNNKNSINSMYYDQYEIENNIALNSKNLGNLAIYTYSEMKKPTYDYLKSVTVFIHAINFEDNVAWSGTGVIVKTFANGMYILTNNHVSDGCEDKTNCTVIDNEKSYKISVIKRSEEFDMALVKIDDVIDGKQAVRGLSVAKEQDRVYVVGHHLGRPFFYSEGTFSGYDDIFNASVVGLPIGPGNSGSGVIDKNGNLVSLVYAVNVVGYNFSRFFDMTHGLCVDGQYIQEFLKGIVE
jgi:serine protease Do